MYDLDFVLDEEDNTDELAQNIVDAVEMDTQEIIYRSKNCQQFMLIEDESDSQTVSCILQVIVSMECIQDLFIQFHFWLK